MKTAILIIDVQNFFINRFTKDIPDKIRSFLDKNSFDLLIFTKFIYSRKSPFAKFIKNPRLIKSFDTDIVPELQNYASNNNVFVKTTFSSLKSKKLLKLIQKENIKRLYICGFDTDGCVLSTAFEAFDIGFNVGIIEDLCASHHGYLYHKEAVKILQKNIKGSLIKSSELV